MRAEVLLARPVALRVALAVAALGGLALLLPPRAAPWTQAVLLMWDSDMMAVVAVVVCASVWVLVGAAQRRAITPRLSLWACATVGSGDELLAHRSLIAPSGRSGRSAAWGSGDDTHWAAALTPSTAAAWLTKAVAVALLSIGAVIVLGASGHLPRAGTADTTAVLMAVAWLAAAGAVWALQVRRRVRDSPVTKATRAVIARRGPHALVVAVVGEIALGLAVAFVAAVLTHTAGSPAPGVAEVVAIALLARLFTFVPFPPIGLGLADGILVFGLTWVQVPMKVAIATALVWRVTGLAVITVGFLAARRLRPHVASAGEVTATPTDSRLGRFVHRAGFALLALLPGRLASVARRRLFDAMFGLADDPWDYALMPYEQRKQAQLAAAIPSGAGVIVEVGCADGHNVAALARLHPGSTVIGIDISERAIATAARRVHSHTNAMVVRSDARSVADALDEFRGQVNVLVLSEVLYYLGTSPQVQQALMPTRALLSPDATVVLVHGAYDAQRLHAPACTALGVVRVTDTVVDDPDRPYIVTVALTTRDEGSA
ncbi:MAG: methyltransferase [Dermatophilaceae bacterium]